jgi:hypothetical protein
MRLSQGPEKTSALMVKMRAKMRIKMKFENRPLKRAVDTEALTKKNGDG